MMSRGLSTTPKSCSLAVALPAALLATALLLPASAWAGFAPGATLHTETTRYSYNADSALTALSTTLDQGSAQTAYFTWDNFLPATADPSTGTVRAGNGNLLGYGAAPGSTASAAFSFDRRNRLTGYAGAGRQVAYAYTAGGLLAAATPASGSGLRFYHDSAARMTNLRQDAGSAGELWSGDLGRVRSVGDGAEQVRLRPRKDVAGTYDAGSETVAAYRYDAYGAQSAAASAQYDIHANPVQYAGEYRDALWGGYYLRARWYPPELPLFLSRDPVAHLDRYGYAGGNPVMRVDPSGRSWKSFENSFAHGRMGWQRWLQHFGGSNAWYAHVARLTAGMLLGPLQMVANPAGFVNAIVHDTGGMDFFLAAGVVSEGAASYFGLRLTTIAATQTVGGAGQSTLAAFDRSFSHFNAGTFVTGLEYTAGAELDTFLPRLVRASRPALRAARDWVEGESPAAYRYRRDSSYDDYRQEQLRQANEQAAEPRPAPKVPARNGRWPSYKNPSNERLGIDRASSRYQQNTNAADLEESSSDASGSDYDAPLLHQLDQRQRLLRDVAGSVPREDS